MSGSINKAIIVGNVGSDPEIRVSQTTGAELATFSIATSEKWKDKTTKEQREKTDWHRIVVFSIGLVKIVKDYVKKGSKLYIEGKMQTREYEGQTGEKKYTTEVVLAAYNGSLILLDTKKIDGVANTYSPSLREEDSKSSNDFAKEIVPEPVIDEDIPF